MDKKIVGLMVIFFLSFGIFASIVLFNKSPLTQFIRAEKELTPSAKNSLVFAYPLTVKADGVSKNKVTIFVRNDVNNVIPNSPVTITTTLGEPVEKEVTTGKDGKAEFNITSVTSGIAEITATAGNVTLLQKVTVKFE